MLSQICRISIVDEDIVHYLVTTRPSGASNLPFLPSPFIPTGDEEREMLVSGRGGTRVLRRARGIPRLFH